ncbi:DUF3012 domain-containing protein [Cellvibrio japonicus]|nr:DUF3012 domain-containing protein [Cellvibrio japonicus]QEI12399.1 DUF3012 domain-containing protein [Cellvibrio japonicus]QEI15972.1 DUF3012 domain-containing protein [Cellvibrio japonicus]QEI19551.1 DUF3012 domain-containing protein [Cellvibrio japonicus]
MGFVREHKWLVIVMLASVLVIIAGLLTISYTNKQQAAQIQELQRLDQIAKEATQTLLDTAAHAEEPIEDVIPQESVEKVKAMNGQAPAQGSEDWCHWMMVKDADSWTLEEQSLFARHCI